jgi:hypothetical protein
MLAGVRKGCGDNGATSLGGVAGSLASMESSCEMQEGVVVMELDGKKIDAT